MSLYSPSNVNHVIREHLAVLSVGILKPNSKLFVVTVIDLQILMLAFPRGDNSLPERSDSKKY